MDSRKNNDAPDHGGDCGDRRASDQPDNSRQRKWFLAKVHRLWGSVAEREYTWEELESISHYAKHQQEEKFMIDDITWNDLGMDQIFMLLNTTVSSCGKTACTPCSGTRNLIPPSWKSGSG